MKMLFSGKMVGGLVLPVKRAFFFRKEGLIVWSAEEQELVPLTEVRRLVSQR